MALAGCRLGDNSISGRYKESSSGVGVTMQFSSGFNEKTYLTEILVEVSFTEPVESLTATDFSITNGTITQIVGSGFFYTLTVAPTSYGAVAVNYLESAAHRPAAPVPTLSIEYTRYPYPVKTFSRPNTSSGGFSSIASIPNSSDQVLVGNFSGGFQSGIYLRRETEAGEVVWDKYYTTFFYFDDVIIGDDIVYAVGTPMGFTSGIFALDLATGAIHWARAVANSAPSTMDFGEGLVALDSGDLLMFSQTNNVSMGDMGGTVVKTDSDGTIVWHKRFGGTGGNDSLIQDAVKSPSNTGVAIGRTSTGIWFFEVDGDGTVIQNKSIDPNASGPFNAQAITPATGGGYYVVAGTGDPVGILKLDNTGEVVWSWTASGPVNFSLADVIELSNGNIAAVGGINSPSAGVVMTLDTSGQFLWAKRFETMSFSSVTEASNGALKVVGAASITMINADGTPVQYDCNEWSDWAPNVITPATYTVNAGPSQSTSNINDNQEYTSGFLDAVALPFNGSESLVCEP